MEKIAYYWSGPEPIFRILIVGSLAYIALVVVLRFSGQRTLASMNAFDFIITVTIGSAFGRILTARSITISEAVVAFALLAALQYVFSKASSHWPAFKNLITSAPALLFYHGNFLEKTMRSHRINKGELLAAARKKGFNSMGNIEAVILETDGSFSVIEKHKEHQNSTYSQIIENK